MTGPLQNLEMEGTFLMFRPLSIVIMWAQVAAAPLTSSIYRRQVCAKRTGSGLLGFVGDLY